MQSRRARSRHLRLPDSQRHPAYAVSVVRRVAVRCLEGIGTADAMPGAATMCNMVPMMVDSGVAFTAVLPREIEIVRTP